MRLLKLVFVQLEKEIFIDSPIPSEDKEKLQLIKCGDVLSCAFVLTMEQPQQQAAVRGKAVDKVWKELEGRILRQAVQALR